MLRSAAALLAWRRRTDPDRAASALAVDGLSLAQYIRRAAGERVLERLIEPVFRGTRSWNPEDVSAAFYLSTMPHLIGRDTVYTLRDGMGRLTQRLAEDLQVQYGVRVERIESRGGRCFVGQSGAAGSREWEADLVVCATEGSRAASLRPKISAAEHCLLSAVRYNSLGVLHLALDGDLPPALEFAPRSAATRIATWQQTPASGAAPAMLYCQLTPEAVQEARERQWTDRLRQVLWSEIEARIPDLGRRVRHAVNQWIEFKLPVFYPGYGREVARFLHWQEAAPRRIYYCGDYLAQALLNGACRSGTDTAATIVRHWR
ncbi:MAG: FAD-dependent oxidoreductase [Rubrivivax sp.]